MRRTRPLRRARSIELPHSRRPIACIDIELASDCNAQVIVGVKISTSDSGMVQFAPMVSQVQQRLDQATAQWLVDGGFPAHEQLDAVANKTEVYAPVPQPKVKADDEGYPIDADEHQPEPGDSAAVA